MNDQEVLDAVNLAKTLYAEDNDESSPDTPTHTTPVASSASASSPDSASSTADRERQIKEMNLGDMLNEFDDLCFEAEATDPRTRQSHDIHENTGLHHVPNVEENVVSADGLEDDQCSWCGFRDHVHKTRASCPQHPDYNGTNHEKGDKVSPEWVPGTRASHSSGGQNPRGRMTSTSVRSAPLAASFTTKDWTVGVGALNSRSNFAPKEFTGQSVLTYPKTSLGWTVDTSPRDLVRQFYPVSTCMCTPCSPHAHPHTHTCSYHSSDGKRNGQSSGFRRQVQQPNDCSGLKAA